MDHAWQSVALVVVGGVILLKLWRWVVAASTGLLVLVALAAVIPWKEMYIATERDLDHPRDWVDVTLRAAVDIGALWWNTTSATWDRLGLDRAWATVYRPVERSPVTQQERDELMARLAQFESMLNEYKQPQQERETRIAQLKAKLEMQLELHTLRVEQLKQPQQERGARIAQLEAKLAVLDEWETTRTGRHK